MLVDVEPVSLLKQMKTSSAKAKGRLLQKWFTTESNCKGYEPLVVIKRNRVKPLVLCDAEYFVRLHNQDEKF